MQPFFTTFCILILFGIITYTQAFIPTLNDQRNIGILLDKFDRLLKIDIDMSYNVSPNQPSSQPSSHPTSIPTSIQLQTIPFEFSCTWSSFWRFNLSCSYFTYLIMFSGLIIIIAWVVFCNDESMTCDQILYQSLIYVITIGDQVTDYLFILNLYFSLEHSYAQKIHGNPTAPSKYHDTLIFIILVAAFKCLVFFVNYLCAEILGELKLLVTCNFHVDYQKISYACIKSVLMFVFAVISNLVLFFSAISNSELNFTLYGKKENKYPMTLIGLLADDVPQLILQVAYVIVEYRKYNQSIAPIQIASFLFMFLRLTYVIYRKYIDEKYRLQGEEEGRNYREVAMDGVATVTGFLNI